MLVNLHFRWLCEQAHAQTLITVKSDHRDTDRLHSKTNGDESYVHRISDKTTVALVSTI